MLILIPVAAALTGAAGFAAPPAHPAPAPPVAPVAPAQVEGRVWVFLMDKGIGDAAERARAVAALEDEFPARAVERRRLRRTEPGVFDERDLPVAAAYAEAIAAAGGEVHIRSRWLNAVSVRGDRESLARIEA